MSQGHRKVLYFAAAIHFLFFIKQIFFGNTMIQDSEEYLFAADNLLHHGTLYSWNLNHAFNPDWLTKRPFLYPLFLLIFKLLSFGNSKVFYFLVYLVQNLISLFNIHLSLKIVEKIGVKFRPGYAILFLLFSTSQAIYSNFIMSEILMQLCFVTIAYLWIHKEFSSKLILWTSLLLMAAMAIKPVMMAAIFIFPLLYLIFYFKRFKIRDLIICLLPLLFFQINVQINSYRTGYAHYSSISNINLIHYNSYVTLMKAKGAEYADSSIDRIKAEASLTGSYPSKQAYIREGGKQIIQDHLGLYAALHLRGIAFALVEPGRFDFTQFFRLSHPNQLMRMTNDGSGISKILKTFLNPLGIVLLFILIFNLIRLFKIFEFIFKSRVSLRTKFIILIIPVYILTMTGPIGTSRFFMPLIPFALIAFLLASYRGNKKKEA